MSDYDAARRIRILRAGAYKCGVRDQRGVLCGAPACQVDELYRYPICAYCIRYADEAS